MPKQMTLQRIVRYLVVMAVALVGLAAEAAGEKRVALVIGNSAYPSSPLANPVNDARAMAKALKEHQFEVILRENATKTQMEKAIAEFGEKLSGDGIGLVYYAGHGIQASGNNYLIPVDASLATEQRLKLETVNVDVLLDQMVAARTRVSMVILDACRNNPFERRFRSTSGGLAQINAPEGTLIAYATAPGKVAADGDGENGLYTSALLKAIREPGIKVEEVFKRVRSHVVKQSAGQQIPWEASSLVGDFYFSLPTGGQPAFQAIPPQPPVQQAAVQQSQVVISRNPEADVELAFWNSVKDSKDPGDLEEYLRQYPAGKFAGLAERRIQRLKPPSKAKAEVKAEPQAETIQRPPPQPPAKAPAAVQSQPQPGGGGDLLKVGVVQQVDRTYQYLVFEQSQHLPDDAHVFYVRGVGGGLVELKLRKRKGNMVSAVVAAGELERVVVGGEVVIRQTTSNKQRGGRS